MKAKMIRFPQELISRIEKYVARRHKQDPGVRFTSSDAIRYLLSAALTAVERETAR